MDQPTTSEGPSPIERSGVEIRVALIDHNRTDEDGEPVMVGNRQMLTNEQLARMDQRDFVEHTLSMAARNILDQFRSEGYEEAAGDHSED